MTVTILYRHLRLLRKVFFHFQTVISTTDSGSESVWSFTARVCSKLFFTRRRLTNQSNQAGVYCNWAIHAREKLKNRIDRHEYFVLHGSNLLMLYDNQTVSVPGVRPFLEFVEALVLGPIFTVMQLTVVLEYS